MDLVMQRMMETHTQLTQVVTQNMISSKSNELPPGVQQLLDAHTHIVQMASRIMTNNNNNISPSDPSNNKPKDLSSLCVPFTEEEISDILLIFLQFSINLKICPPSVSLLVRKKFLTLSSI
jgi:hypothetical protein